MKLSYIAITLIILASSVSCQQKPKEVQIPEYITEEIKQISSTPDSLLTSEQIKIKSDVFDILKASLKIENNKLVNKSTPENFEKRGLSKYYYYVLEKNIEEVNNSVNNSEFGYKNIEEVYDDMLKAYDQRPKENKE
ncbi:MAG: hypothetical protein LBN74_06175 [Prevotella sp.]|jgi:hypothetical protein|nr:hypothetical protein [Prevotella sp.]